MATEERETSQLVSSSNVYSLSPLVVREKMQNLDFDKNYAVYGLIDQHVKQHHLSCQAVSGAGARLICERQRLAASIRSTVRIQVHSH